MKAWTVAKSECMGKRNLALGALFLGLMGAAAPLLPGMRTYGNPDAHYLIGACLGGVVSLCLALLLGATLMGSDLQEGRAGFYFARPLGAGSLYFGKLLAGLGLSLGAGALAFLPSLAVAWGPSAHLPAWSTLGLAFQSAFLLLGVSHVASVSLRCRSPWVLLDIGATALAVWIGWTALSNLGASGALQGQRWLGMTLFLALPVLVATAGYLQVSRGRADLRASHRVLSLASAALLLGAALGSQAYARWFLTPGPESLRSAWVDSTAPRGDWAFLVGQARFRGDFRSRMLWNTSNGAHLRLGKASLNGGEWVVRFSADGRRAAWWQAAWSSPERPVLWVADLQDRARARETTIPRNPNTPSEIALSEDGNRVAVLEREDPEGTLRVYDLRTDELLVSVPYPGKDYSLLTFLSPDRVRLHRVAFSPGGDHGDMDILELDIPSRKLTVTGHVNALTALWTMKESRERDRLLLWVKERDGLRLALCDARLGTELACLVSAPNRPGHTMTLLQDGRIVWIEVLNGRGTLHLADRDGRELAARDLGTTYAHPWIQAEVAPGRLLLESTGKLQGETTRVVVDVATGAVEDWKANPYRLWRTYEPLESHLPGTLGSRLFVMGDKGFALRGAEGGFQPLLPGTRPDLLRN